MFLHHCFINIGAIHMYTEMNFGIHFWTAWVQIPRESKFSCVIHRPQEHQGSYGLFYTVAPPPSSLGLIIHYKPTLLGTVTGNCHRGRRLINLMKLLAGGSPQLICHTAFAGGVSFHPTLYQRDKILEA